MPFWFLLGICLLVLYILSKLSQTLKFCVKILIIGVYSLIVPTCCSVVALFNPGSSKNLFLAQFFNRLLRTEQMLGIRVERTDWFHLLEARRPFVVVSNHQSMLDVHVMVQYSPNGTAPIAKKSLLYVPIFGIVSCLCGAVFINRSKGQATIDAMRKVGVEMKRKDTSLWIFPEGTRNNLDRVGDFKKGAFHLAIQAGVPVVPVVVYNTRNVIDTENYMFNGGVIRVKALPSIDTDGMTSNDVDDLTHKVHALIYEEFDEDFKNNESMYKHVLPLKTC